METKTALHALGALSHESRLAAYRQLMQAGPEGLSVGELRERLDLPPATLTAHLNVLRAAALVQDQREGRVIRVRANYLQMNALMAYLSENCCAGGAGCDPAPVCIPRASGPSPLSPQSGRHAMTDRTYNALFLCTGNSARSQMAEALTNFLSKGRIRAYSAGSHPTGEVHPLALRVLQDIDIPTDGLRSKSWQEFAAPDAPQMDLIITVCDRAAGEQCPVWPGHPVTAHWNVSDPADALGEPEQVRKAFAIARQTLQQRISLMLALRMEALDRLATETTLRQIGDVTA